MRQPWMIYKIHDVQNDEKTMVAFNHELTPSQRAKLSSLLRTAREDASFVKPHSRVTWAIQQLENSAPIDGRVLVEPSDDDVITF